jgi:DNA repair protein RadA/Sms
MKAKTVFYCTECGNEMPKWMGRCNACGSWNTIVEQRIDTKSNRTAAPSGGKKNAAKLISKLDISREIRFQTGISELDRVLGGGVVTGSLVLVGGAPGIGKSTLLLQICSQLKNQTILYVTGEESEQQLKMRANRLAVQNDHLYVLAETNLLEILKSTEEINPEVLIVDSIQTLYNADLTSAPGSVGQVKDCAMALLQLAKGSEITVFLIGHINKEGAIAGPKVLEHMVDCVLYFEGERSMSYRILRAVKNRFGSTNEIGVFEMEVNGLTEVQNPSEALLSGMPKDTPGTCVTCIIEGTRPLLAEIQALVTPSSLNVPRRNVNGIEYNRTMMLLAILEKRAGYRIGGCDVYLNVIGGLNIEEPAADLTTAIAIVSSYKDIPVDNQTVSIGELGLTGELRQVSQIEARLAECARLGFNKCIIPQQKKEKIKIPEGLHVVQVRNIKEALHAALSHD